ncbi:MAG TPA: ABC transporter permease, partial [Solirubrobacterales bacterium]
EAAEDLGVGVGDVVDLDHPAPGAGGELRQERTATRVAGLHPNPFRTFAYMDRDAAVALGVPGIVNSLDVYPEPGASKTEIARALFDEPAVASVEKVTATTTFVRERLDDFIGVLRLTIGFALALALLIAFNSTRISADERARENATMIAFGIPAREAIGVTVAESMITGILGTLAGLAGGAAVIGWVVSTTLPQTLPDVGLVVSLSAGSMLAAGLVGVVAVTLAPLAGARRIAHMDVPSTLRVVE